MNRIASFTFALILVVAPAAVAQTSAAPVLTNLNDAKAQLWNSGLTVIDTNASVTDSDSPDFLNGNLTVRVIAGQVTDVLSIRSLTTVGNINLSGTDIRLVASTGFTSVGTLLSTLPTTGTSILRIRLKSTATPAVVTKILRSVTYRNQSAVEISATRTLRFQLTDGDGGSAFVDKVVRLGTLSGVHNGSFVGTVTAGGFQDTIPGLSVPVGANKIKATITNGAATVELPGLSAIGTGTVSPTGTFSVQSNGSISSLGVKVQFTGTMKLNPNGSASGTGTWSIVNSPGVTGSGTWSTTRP